jgi:hypothetical protein
MLAIILYLFRFVRLLGSGHQAVAVENLALRLQAGRIQEEAETACAAAMGSAVLGWSLPRLAWLAANPSGT